VFTRSTRQRAAVTTRRTRHDYYYVLAKPERKGLKARAVLGSKYDVVAAQAMNGLFKRVAGVENAKIADLRVRTKQVPRGPDGLRRVGGPGDHEHDGRLAP
jgi:hypothetical protein